MEELFQLLEQNQLLALGTLVLCVWWVLSNWSKLRLPYVWLMSWYEKQKRKDEFLQMLLEDHKRTEALKTEAENQEKQIQEFADNQHRYHQESIDIRNELASNIKEISNNMLMIQEADKKRDAQIDGLMQANMVLLGQEINKKYKQYVCLHGIPEDEVDEFTTLHAAYKSLGGNHTGDAKYDYVRDNLGVIPVETKLIYDRDEK